MNNLCDLPSERAVLAGVFQYGAESYLDICDIVTSNTFVYETNKLIWACVEHSYKKTEVQKIDYPTLLSSAKAIGLPSDFLSKQEDKTHLRSLSNMPVIQDNVRRMAAKIRKLEIARLLGSQLELAKESIDGISGDETIDQILSKAEQPIFDFTSLLTDAGQQGVVLMGDGAEEYIQHLIDNPRDMMGISTGMPHYDIAIGGGVRPNSVDVIAARAKAGKTQLVDNIGVHISRNVKIPVLNVDTEMTKDEHLIRIAANMAGVATYDIETGRVRFNEEHKSKVLAAARELKTIPYYYESVIGMRFEDILSSMRRWVTRTVGLNDDGSAKPCIILYDYIKLMSSDFLSGAMQEYQALGFIMSGLKNFMGRYKVGCICLAQLNREGTEREDATVVSGSDRIIHYCTSFSIYKKKGDEERAEAPPLAQKYTHKMIPVLSRHGGGLDDGDYINIESEYSMGRVTEGPTRFEVESAANIEGTTQEGREED